MKKWMIFSLLATIGCTILALIFGSMADFDLMKEYGQRAAKIKFSDIPFQDVSVKLDAKDIERLTVKSRAISIKVLPSPDDLIYVDYSFSGMSTEGELPQNRNGNELTLDADEFMKNDGRWKIDMFQSDANFNIQGEDARLTIKVPAHIQTVILKSISGNLKAESMQIQKLVADAVSGDVIIPSGQIEEIEVRNVSGDLKLEAAAKKIDAKSVSGNIKMTLQKADAGLNCETTSGDVVLKYEKEPNAMLSFRTMSGQVRVSAAQRMKVEGELDNFKLGSGAGYIKIKTISGDAKVQLDSETEE
jgi:hypothetical protein